jgi:hypothetical protein
MAVLDKTSNAKAFKPIQHHFPAILSCGRVVAGAVMQLNCFVEKYGVQH